MGIRYFLLFYLRTLRISIPVAVIAVYLARQSPMMMEDALKIGLQWFPVFGLGLDAVFRWVFRKKKFYFYHNGSWSIGGLYLASFVLSVFVSLILHLIFKLTMQWY